jgi:hypothetical protein
MGKSGLFKAQFRKESQLVALVFNGDQLRFELSADDHNV